MILQDISLLEIIFRTGTSQGVPMIAQPEGDGCDLDNPKNWRTRTSIHVEMGGHHIQVDAARIPLAVHPTWAQSS